MATPAQPRIKVFFSYAHEDEDLVDLCRGHLSACDREHLIQIWHDRQIPPGVEWKGFIDRNLSTSHVVVLFISHDFLQSEYCRDVEMAEALKRHTTGSARVIPVILRPCAWEDHSFSMLQVLPAAGKPITKWDNRDEACLDVARGIMSVVAAVPPDAAVSEPPVDVPSRPQESPVSDALRSELGSVQCSSAACQSPDVRLTELPVVIESLQQDDRGGWIAHGRIVAQYSITGECLTCGRIFDVARRAIPMQFSDLTCGECSESSHLEYRPTGFRKVDGAYEFGVMIRCSECQGTRTLSRVVRSLLRTVGIEVGRAGIKVHEAAP
jgi:hypothetical protein